MSPRPVAVVTGANRGLGLETARQLLGRGWAVALTARDAGRAAAAAAGLADRTGGEVESHVLDVTDADQAARLAAFVAGRFGRLDALVNNAGAIYDAPSAGILDTDPRVLLDSVANNTASALGVTRALAPLLLADGGANVVMVSSGMGGLAEMGAGYPGYRLSKAGLNVLTRLLHNELHGRGLRVNSVCPGWVRTDMGGTGATRDVVEGAAGIVWAATLGPDGPSGGFFRDGAPIPW